MTTIVTAAMDWIEYRRQLAALGQIRATTWKTQTANIRAFTADHGATPLGELRKSLVDIWTATRLTTHAPVTVASEVATLRQFLNWCVDERLLKERPRLPTVSVPNVEIALPDDAIYVWYLKRLPERHAAALEFMMLTGLAPHELERLRPVDARHDALNIGARADFAVKQPSRRRSIPMNPRALLLWHSATAGRAPDAAVWPSLAATQKAMRRLFLSASDAPDGGDGVTPKMMRKWFASKVATEHSEAVLQRLLGHAPGSPITRRHYTRSNNHQLAEAVTGLRA